MTGPGHGGPGIVANAYLEGTYSELYAQVGRDEQGLQQLFRQFSFPGGIPSHAAPETPGSIHEGGELGYALAHAFGAAFDNPGLTVACVIGDGEAETGPLATSWHANKFLNPATDGAVLPILHLNGYKIANPTVLARIPEHELRALLTGYGWRPLFVTGGFDGEDPARVHQLLAETLDEAFDEIRRIQAMARSGALADRPTWPMIVLRTPKGWTCPKFVDGKPVEGTWRAHQVPITEVRENDGHRRLLEEWMRSYRPEELFDETGALVSEIAALSPAGDRRMSASPHANGGTLLRDLLLPDFRDYAVDVAEPGCRRSEATRVLGAYLRDVIAGNPDNFRIVGPDETASNRLTAVFETTTRAWQGERAATDEGLGPDGRVLEVLSEHLCQGWLEGYLLTGRHGLFNCYEAFIHIIDSMFNQHAKWLKTSARIPWRMPLASLNYLLTSHVWQQDHNGFSHQDPGFIDHVVNKKAEVIRVYLPPDTNCLLSVMDHCLRSRHYVNVVVAGKAPALTYLSIDEAIAHCTRGIGIWEWASSDGEHEPDVVMACCGDVPTLETLAAVSLLRTHLPELRVRVVNVVDLMRLAVRQRASARTARRRVRRALHGRPPGHLRLPRLPLADPPPDLPPRQSRQSPRPRLQGGGHDDDALRHGHAQRPRPLPPRDGRDRPRPRARRRSARTCGRTCRTSACAVAPTRASTARTRPTCPAGPGRADRLAGVLVVNAGSTSLKLSVVDEAGGTRTLASLGDAPGDIVAVGHRVVHGGPRFRAPVLLDDATLAELRALVDLAPLHNAPALAAIDEARRALPAVPQVAVFDTEFHATLPDEASTYAVPERWRTQWHVRRYGFHGLSVAVGERAGAGRAARRLPPRRGLLGERGPARADRSTRRWASARSRAWPWRRARARWIRPRSSTCCAAARGRRTRSSRRWSASRGCSGSRGSRRASRSSSARDEPAAQLALDVYCYRIAGAIGAMAVALGGLDAIVFSGGVGEGSALVRARVCGRLGFLGVQLDGERNAAVTPDADVAQQDSRVRVVVVHAREDVVAARAVRSLLGRRT